jgi:hypothetical protein
MTEVIMLVMKWRGEITAKEWKKEGSRESLDKVLNLAQRHGAHFCNYEFSADHYVLHLGVATLEEYLFVEKRLLAKFSDLSIRLRTDEDLVRLDERNSKWKGKAISN